MSDLRLEVPTAQGLTLALRYEPAYDNYMASLHLRPSASDRRFGITLGTQVAFVMVHGRSERRPHIADDVDVGAPETLFFGSALFDLKAGGAARVQEWLDSVSAPAAPQEVAHA